MHIEGVAQSFTDSEKLKYVLNTLTKANESAFKNSWEPDYLASMLSGIEITITSIRCKFKLSQNRSIQDQSNVQKQLAHGGYKTLANAINNS